MSSPSGWNTKPGSSSGVDRSQTSSAVACASPRPSAPPTACRRPGRTPAAPTARSTRSNGALGDTTATGGGSAVRCGWAAWLSSVTEKDRGEDGESKIGVRCCCCRCCCCCGSREVPPDRCRCCGVPIAMAAPHAMAADDTADPRSALPAMSAAPLPERAAPVDANICPIRGPRGGLDRGGPAARRRPTRRRPSPAYRWASLLGTHARTARQLLSALTPTLPRRIRRATHSADGTACRRLAATRAAARRNGPRRYAIFSLSFFFKFLDEHNDSRFRPAPMGKIVAAARTAARPAARRSPRLPRSAAGARRRAIRRIKRSELRSRGAER